jgi:hypothetical protein
MRSLAPGLRLQRSREEGDVARPDPLIAPTRSAGPDGRPRAVLCRPRGEEPDRHRLQLLLVGDQEVVCPGIIPA